MGNRVFGKNSGLVRYTCLGAHLTLKIFFCQVISIFYVNNAPEIVVYERNSMSVILTLMRHSVVGLHIFMGIHCMRGVTWRDKQVHVIDIYASIHIRISMCDVLWTLHSLIWIPWYMLYDDTNYPWWMFDINRESAILFTWNGDTTDDRWESVNSIQLLLPRVALCPSPTLTLKLTMGTICKWLWDHGRTPRNTYHTRMPREILNKLFSLKHEGVAMSRPEPHQGRGGDWQNAVQWAASWKYRQIFSLIRRNLFRSHRSPLIAHGYVFCL
jgi:hypothetical protein